MQTPALSITATNWRSAIIAKTRMGVSFMEGTAKWHHGMLTDPKLLQQALDEVKLTRNK